MQRLTQVHHDHIDIVTKSKLKESNYGTRMGKLDNIPSIRFIQRQLSLGRPEKYLKKFPKKDPESETTMKFLNHKISTTLSKKASEN